MYVLRIVAHVSLTKPLDAHDCSGMRENSLYAELKPEDQKANGFRRVTFHENGKTLGHGRRIDTLLQETKTQRPGLRLRRWMIGILAFLLMSLVAINSYTAGQFRIVRFNKNFGNSTTQVNLEEIKTEYKPIITPGYLVRNKGCRIPDMDPFDPVIKRFIHKEKPITCDYGEQPPLVKSNDTSVYIDPKARVFFYNSSEKADCCWRSFWRMKTDDNGVTFHQDCYPFEESARVNGEFIKVECRREKERIYRDYHAFVPRKRQVERRCANARPAPGDDPRLSVLIVGLDSVSRLNFHRMMPKTIKALEKLKPVEMLGYNKVADNTYPNLVPVLSGLSQGELKDHCWQEKTKPFDDCPFLWKNFSESGYRTVFAEDACEMTTFNYLKPGFKVQPTDYYLRPYCVAMENDIGNTCKLNANLCVGTRKTFDNLLDYTRKVAYEFRDDLYFALFWEASLTHDFFNYPQLGDDSYADFIEFLVNEKLLNNTALIVMSDHGMRWGEFRQTYQGRSEDSLPFVFLALPDWWRDRFQGAWANLRRNSRSLTTGFDLHETLIDILHPHRLRESFVRKRTKSLASDKIPRGVSWFLPIPDHRTCEMADIPEHYCMCHGINDVPMNDTNLRESVNFLVNELNDMLKKYPQCAVLSLGMLKDAKMWTDQTDDDGNPAPWVDYMMTIVTIPSDAIFEATVRYRSDDKSRKLIGSVSRLNAYGKQSACVDEFHMRLYCYCL